MELHPMDGKAVRLPKFVVKNNLAVLLRELDQELDAELCRLHDECHRKIGRLLEDLHDAAGESE